MKISIKSLIKPVIVILVLMFLFFYLISIDYLNYLLNILPIITPHYLVTLFETIISIIISITLSIILFIVSIKHDYIRDVSLKILIIFQTIPLIIIAPVLLTFFGFSISLKIFIVSILGVYPILLNLDKAYKNIDEEMYTIVELVNVSKIKHVIIPSVSSSLFSGIKLTTSYSFASVILTEFIGGQYGLGIYLTRALKNFDLNAIYLIVFLSVVTTFGLIKIVDIISNMYLKKYYGGLFYEKN